MSRAFLEHVGRHRSDLEGTNPRLLLLEQMERVLAGEQRREAQRALLGGLSAALRGGGMDVDAAPAAAAAAASAPRPVLARFGLEATWRSLFDPATGSALSLPLIDDSLHARLLDPRALAALAAAPTGAHARLSDCLRERFIGGGASRTLLSGADLAAFFTVFSAEELQAAAAEGAAAAAAAAGAAAAAAAAVPASALPEGREALAREGALFAKFFADEVRAGWARACDVAGDERFAAVAAPRLVARLRALSWPAYPHFGGNPFNFKLTRDSVARGALANYFSLIRAPMDLVRMGEGAAKGAKGPYRGGERAVEALVGDVATMAANALSYYGPPLTLEPLALRTEDFPPPEALPPGFSAAAGGIYGIAWELRERVPALRAHAAAALAHFRRAARRESCAAPHALPQELAAGIAWYVRGDFQEALRAASRAQAVEEGYADLIE